MICSKCGKVTSRLINSQCQGCYLYFKRGGIVHDVLPKRGEIMRDANGLVVCHICGRSFARLGSHAKESHGMTIEEYKAEFGLNTRAKTTSDEYSSMMRRLAFEYDMDKNLVLWGKKTRIKRGTHGRRLGKPSREQDKLRRTGLRRKGV